MELITGYAVQTSTYVLILENGSAQTVISNNYIILCIKTINLL